MRIIAARSTCSWLGKCPPPTRDLLSHLLTHVGHHVTFLREVLPRDAPDAAVMDHAVQHGLILVTCNRDDFVTLASERPHHGVVIVIRRRSRAQERAALLRLVDRATETGLANNINFA